MGMHDNDDSISGQAIALVIVLVIIFCAAGFLGLTWRVFKYAAGVE